MQNLLISNVNTEVYGLPSRTNGMQDLIIYLSDHIEPFQHGFYRLEFNGRTYQNTKIPMVPAGNFTKLFPAE